MTFVGSCNRNLFEMWLEQCLLPQLQRGNVIVIDNASFHHSQAIDEIVAEAGCELWYLPPYSPDLNKIEHWWFVLKNWMRQRWNEFDSFHDCVDAAFKHCPNVFAQRYKVKYYARLAIERVEYGVDAVKELLSTLTIDQRCGVMLEFEDLDPDKFAQLVTDAPQWTEWMA